ncbi:hypothetical protein PVAP13_2NG586720 [Panicum virgatum]|uniref:Uncharacterized protein n=1 Tax=Panicum virgatum TaxID=38727 RepID=A0A8T0VSZ4_PANVG|nr:hypothetical protein PVAP13_2NG586720 [Panicum virgatum]
MQCRHLYLGRLSSTNHAEQAWLACEPQHARGQRRRRGGWEEQRRCRATKRLGCTPQLTTFFCEFLAVAGGRRGRIGLHVAVSIGQDLACPLHPCFPDSIMIEEPPSLDCK